MAAEFHSDVGPSSLERVLACTASVKTTADMPSETSEYAEEGTAAHSLAEFKTRKALKQRAGRRPTSDFWTDEMEECTDDYRDFCMEQYGAAKQESEDAIAFVEQRVDLSEYVPGCFGTVDFMAISEHTLYVTDLKYGRGVQKDADNNPQLMAYGLGALGIADPIFDVEKVVLTIFQPRLSHVSTWEISADDLRKWGTDVLAPKVAEAINGEGTFVAGEHCRFCKAKSTCRARAEYYLKLIEMDFEDPALLTDEEIAEVMAKADSLSKWAADVMAYATAQAIEQGKHFDNWKVVEGRSVRKFNASDEAIEEAAKAAGYTDIYNRSLITLTAFEKLMGKDTFQDVLGGFVEKPAGKLTLVPITDKRPEVVITHNDDFND